MPKASRKEGRRLWLPRIRGTTSRHQLIENQIEHDDEDEHEHEKIHAVCEDSNKYWDPGKFP